MIATMPKPHDVLIIGGGPAGLSAALSLARLLHTVVIFDSGVYRNRYAERMHTLSTWDHQKPSEYRAAARRELTDRYSTVQLANVGVQKAEKLEDGTFKVTDANDQEWNGRKLLLAVGSADVPPEIEGYQENWGKGIFHCLFCHGFEENKAQAAGVLAVGEVANPFFAMHLARQAKQFSENITIFTNGNEKLAIQLQDEAATLDVKVSSSEISSISKRGEGQNGKLTMRFKDGQQQEVNFLVHKPTTKVSGSFVEQLGLEITPPGDLKLGQPFPETNVKGCFAAGDCATGMKSVPVAVSGGMVAAAGISMQLLATPTA